MLEGKIGACFVSRILQHTMAKNRPIRSRDTKNGVSFSLVI